jgi:hypothetical protein
MCPGGSSQCGGSRRSGLKEIPVSIVQHTSTPNPNPSSITYGLIRFDPKDRRTFIGGSDARIIMGDDEARLVRPWREKRGEVEPEDLSDNLIVQLGSVTEDFNRRWYERNTGHAIKDVQKANPASCPQMDGGDAGRHSRTIRRGVRSQIHVAVDVYGRGSCGKAHGAAAAQYVGYRLKIGRAVDHYRRRQVD